jgi:hypothetical protein
MAYALTRAPDGHYASRLIDEFVPSLATVVDNIVVGFDIRLDSQLPRMNCQMFSLGLSSGHFGGSRTCVMFVGTMRRLDMRHPAWSTMRRAFGANTIRFVAPRHA